jgi:uncharacterized protein YbjT (DUF2867 family)
MRAMGGLIGVTGASGYMGRAVAEFVRAHPERLERVPDGD